MFFEGKKNGKGKEYICEYEERGYDDKDWYTYLIYDGNYENDKKNGKGKEYHYGKLVFEGEYLNGEKWKGKEYNYNGRLVFERKYFNGKKWEGKIVEYNSFDKIEFKGEIINGKKISN